MKIHYLFAIILFFFCSKLKSQSIGVGPTASHSIALTSNGVIYTWGDNNWGQLGDGSNLDSNIPILVNTSGVLSSKNIISVGSSAGFSIALASDGTIYTWGQNSSGQLGNGSFTDSDLPVAVTMSGVLSGKNIVLISSGATFAAALASDGTAFTWGNNNIGQLGNGTYARSNVPVAVTNSGALAGKIISLIAAGSGHCIALTTDGGLYTWGYNYYGQLGNGTNDNSNVPVAVETSGVLAGKTIIYIAAGEANSIAVSSDGTVFTWGSNFGGQLGNGTAISSNVPVAVTTNGALSGKIITTVAAGLNHMIALASDGTVYSWGQNFDGQLGNGNFTSSNVPIAISLSGLLSGKVVSKISAGSFHSVAMDTEGQVYSWGWNDLGQLGNGTNTTSNVPVLVNISLLAGGIKILLEGPYSANTMNTSINANIPNSQPYSVGPWNYNGTESTSTSFISSNNIIDWVYLELRSGSSPDNATTVSGGRRAALLRNDGFILDINGSTEIDFSGVPAGNYFIAVYHRNHLSVISSQTITIN